MPLTPVQKELERIAADYRRYHFVRQLSLCWGALLVIGVAILLLQALFEITVPGALPGLAGLAVAALAVVILRTRRIEFGIRDIARAVEAENPRLNSLLLAAAEQEPDPATGEFNFLQARVLREALAANKRSPWHQRFTERLFLAQCGHLVLLTLLLCLFFGLGFGETPKQRRLARRSQITITPGSVPVEKGSSVAIIAEFPHAPEGDVRLIYETASQGERSVVMNRSLEDPLYGTTLFDLQEDARYLIEFADGRSTEFTLTVFEFPRLERADADLHYPAYTRFPPKRIEDTRRITAVEGTQVNYSFYLNKPVKSARLVGRDGSEIPLEPDANQENQYRSAFVLEKDERYRMELVDAAGRTNKVPAEFAFVALPNAPPQLKLQSPQGDQRVSALQELLFQAEAQDDFGLMAYGLAYSVGGAKPELIRLSANQENGRAAALTEPHESAVFDWLLSLEKASAEPQQLVTYYLWAEDLGPDGQVRHTASDLYFAEVRPFEEIFRESNSDSSSQAQQGQQGGGQAARLLQLQKEIIQATWNLQRRHSGPTPGESYEEDITVVRDSQESALGQANQMLMRVQDEEMKALGGAVVTAMETALEELSLAVDDVTAEPLPTALEFEQAAQQALYKLQSREYQVSQSRNSSQSQGGGGQQRAQRQLDQLEMTKEENRYETERQASPMQTPQQQESLQVLNRLKELARRQQEMSERLKELQSALSLAENEKEREELELMLKRLQEEQRQIVQDTDELRQRMQRPENRSRMAEAREQLDQTREEAREAARELQEGNIGQALSSSTRAQEEFDQLSDDFRDATSSEFAEEMRQMRQQSRELAERQEELANRLETMQESEHRTLSDKGEKQELMETLAQQQTALTNLLQNVRTVTEQAEVAEPLLSRQLYDTLRRTSQQNPGEALELASQLLERNFQRSAVESVERAQQTITQLNEDIEQAAESVLGNEAEALRLAQQELDDLARRVEEEMQSATATGTTNDLAETGLGSQGLTDEELEQRLRTGLTSTNETGGLQRLASRTGGETPLESQPRENSTARAGSEAQQPGQPSQSGRPQGQQGGEGEAGAGQQTGNQPQNAPQTGRQEGDNPSADPNGQGSSGGGSRNSQEDREGQRQPGGNFFDNLAGPGGWNNGNGGGMEGPLTGENFTQWSDRLRNVEELLQDPGLRTDVARVLDRARSLRRDYKRHAADPQWELVEAEIIEPLRLVQNRVSEELARHASREALVPVDRDPVPKRYSEAVSRYYERLGSE